MRSAIDFATHIPLNLLHHTLHPLLPRQGDDIHAESNPTLNNRTSHGLIRNRLANALQKLKSEEPLVHILLCDFAHIGSNTAPDQALTTASLILISWMWICTLVAIPVQAHNFFLGLNRTTLRLFRFLVFQKNLNASDCGNQ